MDTLIQVINGVTIGAIYALVALGFHLIFKTVSVLDFDQGDKVVIGGLVALALVNTGLPVIVTFLLVILGGMLAGLVYDQTVVGPTLRRGPDAAIIATVGALLVMGSGHILIWGAEGKPFPPLVRGDVTIGGSRVQTQEFLIGAWWR